MLADVDIASILGHVVGYALGIVVLVCVAGGAAVQIWHNLTGEPKDWNQYKRGRGGR